MAKNGIERERGELGFKGCTEAGSCAKDREAWRERTQGPIPSEGKGHDDDDETQLILYAKHEFKFELPFCILI